MAERKPLISGNWKMHHTHLDAIAIVQKLAYSLYPADYDRADISVHPPFTALRSVQTLLDADEIPIALGAQNVHPAESGPYTGEVSPTMLAKLNVRYVIVGHSERRQHFGETDSFINQKLLAVLAHQMAPILCVGETLAEREAGTTESKCMLELEAGFQGVTAQAAANVVIAYEPIWAIGTGRTASPKDAQETCAAIRSWLAGRYDSELAQRMRIQYGGSVTPANMAELMAEPDIDGALVGGGSLDADSFSRIVRFGR